MELKNFAVDYILDWFQSNRPEMDVRKDWAQNFYNEIKDQLMLLESDNDREAVALFLDVFLGNYYTNPVNQICKEVLEVCLNSFSSRTSLQICFNGFL